jgi:hypothetical protein
MVRKRLVLALLLFSSIAYGQPYGQERYFVNSNDAPTANDVFYGPSVRQPYLENRTLWDYDNGWKKSERFSAGCENSHLREITGTNVEGERKEGWTTFKSR